MKPLVIDVETTIFQKGSPFSACNRLCYVGHFDGTSNKLYDVEYTEKPYGLVVQSLVGQLDLCDLWIGFNFKFDLHWLRRYCPSLIVPHIWDCQLAHFIINRQQARYPSLEDVAAFCGVPGKSGGIAEKYWNKGIDTPEIPQQELEDYLTQDLKATWDVFQWQIVYLRDKPQLKRLIWEACQDLLVTAEMEWNGLKYDLELSKKIGDKKLEEIGVIDSELRSIISDPCINWSSRDHLSCILYGGTFRVDGQETYDFHYKDGRVARKTRHIKIAKTFPQLVSPPLGSKLKKDGFYSTDANTLLSCISVGPAKRIIQLLLKRAELNKAVSTYYHGFPSLYEEMDWTDNIIHGQLNHCVAITGRLSSSKPNQQNLDKDVRQCLITRFPRKI